MDIVGWLRRYSYQAGETACPGDEIAELITDVHEAADEIERLRADLHGHDDIDDCPLCFIEDENKRLRASEDEYIRERNLAQEEIEITYRRHIELLRTALEEIANETDGIECDGCFVRNEIARKALKQSEKE